MLGFLANKVTGPLLPIILGCCGIFLLLYLRMKPFVRPGKMYSLLLSEDNRKESLRSLFLSLAGTLGVGNIAGVAAAISVGGAGSVFWMWIFAILAMAIKYGEVVLTVIYKDRGKGGAATYIEKGLRSRRLGVFYSVLIVITSICVGNVVQSSAAAQSMKVCFNCPEIVTGILFAVITLILIFGGRNRVETFSSMLIPLLTLVYVIVSLGIIIKNANLLPNILSQIMRNAFQGSSLSGGTIGFLTSEGMRLGASRGILSNEAGCGTAGYAHINSIEHPAKQGLWGIVEVIIDTLLLCTMTAFVVLISGENLGHSSNGMAVAINAYSYFGEFGGMFIGVSSALFALASVVCWSYYGVSAMKHLNASKRSCALYLLIYSVTGLIGSIFAPSLVWDISDIAISVLAVFNIVCVLKLRQQIKRFTDELF